MTREQIDRARMYDVLHEVADELKDLYITVDTIKLGLNQELLERQTSAALGSINRCIKTIWTLAHDAVLEYDEEDDPKALDVKIQEK